MAAEQDKASVTVENVQSSPSTPAVAGGGVPELGCCHLKDGKSVDGITQEDCFGPNWGGVDWHTGPCKP